jgi:hypothetical protein
MQHADHLVKSWLKDFLIAHRAAHPDAGWPSENSHAARLLWSAWMKALIAVNATRAEADAASAAMAGEVVWCERHPESIAAIIPMQRERRARELAEKATNAVPLVIRATNLTDEQRVARARWLLDEFYAAGWELRRQPEPGDRCPTPHFLPFRQPDHPGAPAPQEIWQEMQAYKYEVYALLGHPYSEAFPYARGGGVRGMVEALAKGVQS